MLPDVLLTRLAEVLDQTAETLRDEVLWSGSTWKDPEPGRVAALGRLHIARLVAELGTFAEALEYEVPQ